jgi:hypothetical protein
MRIPAVLAVVALALVGPFLPGSFSELPSESTSNSYPDVARTDSPIPVASPVASLTHPTESEVESRNALGSEALALLGIRWQDLGYKVVFMGNRPGYRGMTICKTRRIEIYVRPGDTARRLAYTLAHEFGHVIDVTHNSAESRARWMEKRGIDPKTPWFGCNACSDYATPAGDFAESLAAMLVGPEFYCGRMMPPPAPTDVPNLSQFFSSIGFSGQLLQIASASGR